MICPKCHSDMVLINEPAKRHKCSFCNMWYEYFLDLDLFYALDIICEGDWLYWWPDNKTCEYYHKKMLGDNIILPNLPYDVSSERLKMLLVLI